MKQLTKTPDTERRKTGSSAPDTARKNRVAAHMKKRIGLIALILTFSLSIVALSTLLIVHISGKNQPFTGKAAEYCSSLMDAGFPEDYAVALTKLHLLHPSWSFVPLSVTQTNSAYTWSYVIDRETEKPDTNLIHAGDAYAAYRHSTNHTLYDSGYYQPSRDAVEYFMDPRNFLNEADIFQFYDLSNASLCSENALYAVLSGTFMENTVLENGKTYAQYLIGLGAELGVDPVFLAVKLRQEQGTEGTSPIISGSCGNTLLSYYQNQTKTTEAGKSIHPPTPGSVQEQELLALNGYYNPFNIGASGNGVFSIYRNAMLRAINGSPEKSDEWDGSPSWSTRWKGLYGGAAFLKAEYIDKYQSTVYLQKFNVDGRAAENNFWKQYMQNLSGAMTEGRTLYQFFAANDTLDSACRFLIPVYDGMPKEISADPANGSCAYLAPASARYQTSASLTSPFRLHASNGAVYGEASLTREETLVLTGSFTHSYGVSRLEYSWDGEEWETCSRDGTLELIFSGNLPDYGEHILLLRGEANYASDNSNRKSNRYFLCAVLDVTVIPPPSVELTLQSGNAVSKQMYYEGTEVVLPLCEDSEFAGWVGSDGSFLPSGGSLILTADLRYTALFLHAQALEGAALSTQVNQPRLRFYTVLPNSEYEKLNALPAGSVSFCVRLTRENIRLTPQSASIAGTVTASGNTIWRNITVDTPVLSAADFEAFYSAEFSIELQYSDGTAKTVLPTGPRSSRSAVQVALAALADGTAAYPQSVLDALYLIAPNQRFD